ncbi:MAG: cysteine methyltransferase [Gammaproteobacteria bacterium]|nr:cysteine methyltransferase [Gammaproteobacteria bacterium]
MAIYEEIYKIVRRIPAGNVTSYGRIARMVKCNPRQVGYAMAAIPDGMDVPWHRVVNSKGEISLRKDGYGDHFQRQKLAEEGVIFNEKGRVNFDLFGWIEAELPFLPDDWFDD